MNVLRQIKQCVLFYALLPILILSTTRDLYGTGIIYLSKDFKNTLQELQEKNYRQPWSLDFYSLTEYLKSDSDFAQEKLVSNVIEECLAALDPSSPEAARLIENFLKFKEEISSEYEASNKYDSDCTENCCYKIDIYTQLVDGPTGAEENSTVSTRRHHCCPRICCKPGPRGANGAPGANGATGAPGANGFGFLTTYATFYAFTTTTGSIITQNEEIAFPLNGPANSITRNGLSLSEFVLTATGTYEVNWQVLVDEEGQLALYLNGAMLPQTVVGRRTGSSQIVGDLLISTTIPSSILSVCNPNATPITIVQNDGGAQPDTVTLTIKQIAG